MPEQNNKQTYADTLSIVCFSILIALIVAGSFYNEYKTYERNQKRADIIRTTDSLKTIIDSTELHSLTK